MRSDHNHLAYRLGSLIVAMTITFFQSPLFPAEAYDPEIAKDQEMLIWTGHYDGTISGNMTDYTRDAVRRFQRSNGYVSSGRLKPHERSKLHNLGAARKGMAGFRVVDDTPTGIRIGVPTHLVTETHLTKWGTNWREPYNSIDIDTLRFPGSPNLVQLYNKLKQIKGRKLRYSPLRSSWFVLEGEDKDGRQFYVRADSAGAEVRAFSITYAKSVRAKAFPIAVAMAASFQPFSNANPTIPPTSSSEPEVADSSVPQTNMPRDTNTSGAGDCFNGLGKDCPTIAKDH